MKVQNYVLLATSLLALAACSKGGDNGTPPPAPTTPIVSNGFNFSGPTDVNSIDIVQRRVVNRTFRASNPTQRNGTLTVRNDSCNARAKGASVPSNFDSINNDLTLNFDGNGTLTIQVKTFAGTAVSQALVPGQGYELTNEALKIFPFAATGTASPLLVSQILVKDGVYRQNARNQHRQQVQNVSSTRDFANGGYNADYAPGQPLNNVRPQTVTNTTDTLSVNFNSDTVIRIRTASPRNPQHIQGMLIENYHTTTTVEAIDPRVGNGCIVDLDTHVDGILLR